ncbi:hypothetical protein PR048_001779 [Dryococelus australis]|uniref:HAT C-terminal dimerisation domain-containing protein n=1 Tax=Dryococelus australis TaxID=614101 RepID=A0ABQ9IIA3_9NEOP|nr:hypothetical protein PR048_001779 [Dryococelus australis]
MIRWNSWFKSIQYVHEYIHNLVEFRSQVEGDSSFVEYFQNITLQQVYDIKCSSQFLLKHGSSLIDTIVVLEGSSCPFIHKLYSKLADMQNSFLLVSRAPLGQKPDTLLKAVHLLLRNVPSRNSLNGGLQCHKKLTTLLDQDTTSVFLKSISKLFDTRNISTNPVDDDASTKKIPIPSSALQKELSESYQVVSVLKEQNEVDILNVLLGLKEEHSNFIELATTDVWIPPLNIYSERAFSAHGQILTDLM